MDISKHEYFQLEEKITTATTIQECNQLRVLLKNYSYKRGRNKESTLQVGKLSNHLNVKEKEILKATM